MARKRSVEGYQLLGKTKLSSTNAPETISHGTRYVAVNNDFDEKEVGALKL